MTNRIIKTKYILLLSSLAFQSQAGTHFSLDYSGKKPGENGQNLVLEICDEPDSEYFYVNIKGKREMRFSKSSSLSIDVSGADGFDSQHSHGGNGGNSGSITVLSNNTSAFAQIVVSNYPGRGGNGKIAHSNSQYSSNAQSSSLSRKPGTLIGLFISSKSASYSKHTVKHVTESKGSGNRGKDGFSGDVHFITDYKQYCNELNENI